MLAVAAVIVASALPPAGAQNPGRRAANSDTASPADTANPAADESEPADVGNPVVQLVRDPGVQKELALSNTQSAALNAVYRKIEPRLWQLRDAAAGPGAMEKARLLASMENELAPLLEHEQLDRLRQLALRARGWPGITVEPFAGRLGLSPDQFRQIAAIVANTQMQLQKVVSTSDSSQARDEAVTRLRTEEGTSIQRLLSSEQRQTLSQLVGAPFDLSRVAPLSFAAPELQAADTWFNTPPLKQADLRGKVVAFHFWAFNCSNCVANMPHYTRWYDDLADGGLVVLGMHTPETQAERNVDTLRSKLEQFKIRYPVAVDHDAANWRAWANSVWPSVYLVDKRGNVRYWWYGELNWQGAQGEKLMRERIEQLLAE
jgi:thiol-disulfide isomerase/thioredoxin